MDILKHEFREFDVFPPKALEMPQRDVSIPRMGNWRGNFWWVEEGELEKSHCGLYQGPATK